MTIDFHAHCFIPDAIAKRAIPAMAESVKGIISPVGDGTLGDMLDHLEMDGVDMAVMLPIATKPVHYGVILRNALALRDGSLGDRAKRMVHPFMSIHPADPELGAHMDEIASLGFKGIKVHPYYQNFSLDDPSTWPLFRRAADLGLAVVCHCGFDIGYPDRFDACGPKEVATLMRNVPGLKFVAAHLGGSLGYADHATDELIDLGCYADTGIFLKDRAKDEQLRLLESWPADRLLFGTDFPWTRHAKVIEWVKSVRPSRDWDNVFGGNAMRLLGLA